MDVLARIKSWKQERKRETVRFKACVAALETASDLLARMPDELSYAGITEGKIHMTAYGSSDDAVRDLIARIRSVLGVSRSEKELADYNGTISYITQNDTVHTKVMGGTLPANCTLVPEAHSYITYTMSCQEDK